jgi:4-amino-4-deoxy-L-arabinose transferase-like glycosyltransferase
MAWTRGVEVKHKSAPWVAAGLILAVTLPLFLLGLGDRLLWIPQEVRYALIAREMWQGGEWLLPHVGGMVYPDKPPLLFWAIALLSVVNGGVTAWTARLPVALASIAVCLVTWRLGARLLSPRAGLLAALILATSGGFFWSGRQALLDMFLTLGVTGACWALWAWLGEQQRWGALLAGICMGLATLAKGPVGVVLPTLVALAYLTGQRQWPMVRGGDVLLCGGSFLLVSLAWYLPAIGRGGLPYASAALIHHNVERYLRAWEHVAPWYFFVGAFPAEFLPWALFLPPALFLGAARRGPEDQRGWWFAVCWLVMMFVFFSGSTGKRDIYMLPAFPAAALLVGWLWSRWWEEAPVGRRGWWVMGPALVLALGLWVLAGGIWRAIAVLPPKSMLLLPVTLEARRWTSVLLALGGVLLASLVLLQRPYLVFGGILGCTWLAMMAIDTRIYTPQFNQQYPIAALAHAVAAQVNPGQPLQACGPVKALALSFYLGRYIPSLPAESEVIRYLSAEALVYCVMDLEYYRRLEAPTGRHFPVRVHMEIDGAALLLVANHLP